MVFPDERIVEAVDRAKACGPDAVVRERLLGAKQAISLNDLTPHQVSAALDPEVPHDLVPVPERLDLLLSELKAEVLWRMPPTSYDAELRVCRLGSGEGIQPARADQAVVVDLGYEWCRGLAPQPRGRFVQLHVLPAVVVAVDSLIFRKRPESFDRGFVISVVPEPDTVAITKCVQESWQAQMEVSGAAVGDHA